MMVHSTIVGLTCNAQLGVGDDATLYLTSHSGISGFRVGRLHEQLVDAGYSVQHSVGEAGVVVLSVPLRQPLAGAIEGKGDATATDSDATGDES